MKRSNKLILLIAVVIAILTLLIAASEMGLLTDTNNYNVNLTELNDELTIDMSNWKTIKLGLCTVQTLKLLNMSL